MQQSHDGQTQQSAACCGTGGCGCYRTRAAGSRSRRWSCRLPSAVAQARPCAGGAWQLPAAGRRLGKTGYAVGMAGSVTPVPGTVADFTCGASGLDLSGSKCSLGVCSPQTPPWGWPPSPPSFSPPDRSLPGSMGASLRARGGAARLGRQAGRNGFSQSLERVPALISWRGAEPRQGSIRPVISHGPE